MEFKSYINDNILLVDGAMGTFYALKTGKESSYSEMANITDPDTVIEIHREYINSGAKLIRTNTFAANTSFLRTGADEVERIIRAGVECARKASEGSECFIAASIGPISVSDREDDDIFEEYKSIIDIFNSEKIGIFWFETFADYDVVIKLASYAVSKNPSAICAALFSLNSYGYTRSGLSKDAVISAVSKCPDIFIYGFNCGTGSGHLLSQLRKTSVSGNMAAIPNSGYPDKIMDRTVYSDNAEYFKNNIIEIIDLGISIIGGCCGTTPSHIRKINDSIKNMSKRKPVVSISDISLKHHEKAENNFYEKLKLRQKMIAVELDPPFDADISKIMTGSAILKNTGADLITIADNPLGKPRIDSVLIAAKIKRETEIDVMPHICCRDKNLIAIRASIMGAYVENIRNFLLVTGDPVPGEEKNDIKSVFNFNSVKLMNFVSQINSSLPGNDLIRFGGALNPRVSNLNKLIERVRKKTDAGAEFFLTQPVFTEKEAEVLDEVRKTTGAYVFAGVMPLVSYRNACFIHNEFPGIDIPENILNSFNADMSREESEETGVSVSNEIISMIGTSADGLYFMTPFNRAEMIRKIISRIG